LPVCCWAAQGWATRLGRLLDWPAAGCCLPTCLCQGCCCWACLLKARGWPIIMGWIHKGFTRPHTRPHTLGHKLHYIVPKATLGWSLGHHFSGSSLAGSSSHWLSGHCWLRLRLSIRLLGWAVTQATRLGWAVSLATQ